MILGECQVGKTTLIEQFRSGQFKPKAPTIGIDFVNKDVAFEEEIVRFQL